jgi:Uma2 family endonuclease
MNGLATGPFPSGFEQTKLNVYLPLIPPGSTGAIMLTSVRFGPADHGRSVSDEELLTAEYRSGFDYEVIFGRLYVSPAPDFEHDWIEKHFFGQVFLYSRQHPEVAAYVTDRARVFVPGSDKTTAPEPDLAIYASRPRSDWRGTNPFVVGEVLGGHDVDKDLFRNVELYLRVPSIQEYWVFDIRNDARHPNLIVHRRDNDCWQILEVGAEATCESPWLPGLKLTIAPESGES